ncbi:type II secretion system F family protein [Roseomonas eburnea]|uniref:Type II secretion system F family protein n=1 Tax=Neoroseomonas eburnea TaxID=1346889 RepID=A0A9X9XA86_9PROT|nr:type II secretion system F family protein [Neoroseomonas eburnea]MBR0680622.1 type II secretion system F family protein [Neoroseomonas eburnea]
MEALGIDTGLLAILAVAAAVALAISAAILLARSVEDKDVSMRVQGILRPEITREAAPRGGISAAAAPFRRIGEALRNTTLISEKDLEGFRMAIAAAGYNPRAAVPTFIGVKAVLLISLPVIAFVYAHLNNFATPRLAFTVFGAIFLGIFGPNYFLMYLKGKHEQTLRKGLPDALDLLVVTAEAGLGIETALDRVAREIEHTNRPLALAFLVLVQELRMLPDRRQALERFAQRTDFEGFKRLGGTLSQTLKYGTPLAQALRTLAAEMRTDRMLRIEEKAIRLPALLVIPLILFIMPAVFIALVGPSVLELSKGLFSGIQR